MHLFRVLICLVVVIATFEIANAQSPVCPVPEPDCVEIEGVEGCVKRSPVIFGNPYLVPVMTVRVVSKSNQPAVNAKVSVDYNWEWLEYPYPEKLRGAWSDGSASTNCDTGTDGAIHLNEYRLVPAGWYKGFFTIGMKPRFRDISIFAKITGPTGEHCYGRTEITRKELAACKRLGNCAFVVKHDCS